MFGIFIIFAIVLFVIILYNMNKKLKYKFVKYIPAVIILLLGIYYTYQEKTCTGSWCGLNSDGLTAMLFYAIFIVTLISCIIVDLINYTKNKKHKK